MDPIKTDIQNTVNNATANAAAVANQVGQVVQQPVTEVKKKFPDFFKKKPFIIGMVVVLIFIAILVFLTLNKKPAIKNANQDVLLETVAGRKIYKSTVEKAAESQYSKSTVNNDVLKGVLNSLTEQTILDYTSATLGINVEATESALRARSYIGSATKTQIPNTLLTKARYDILKEKFTTKFVNSRTAFVVSFWTASDIYAQHEHFDATQSALAKKQQVEGKIALPEIADLIKKGNTPIAAAAVITNNSSFVDLKKIIAVNGYILGKTNNTYVFIVPKVYTSSDKKSLEPYFYDTLFAMKPGDLKSIINTDGSTGYVIKMVAATDSQFSTYDEWLADQVKKLVVISNPL